MIRDLKDVYVSSWRFMVTCPILFAVPVMVEGIQHVVEYQIGMFDSMAAAQLAEEHPARMAWGFLKAVTLFVSAYWIIRFLGLGAEQARRFDRKAARLFVPVLIWGITWAVAMLWGGRLLALADIEGNAAIWLGVGIFLGQFVLETALAPWKVGAALGNERLTFGRALKLTAPHLASSAAIVFLAMLPVMVAHYALGIGAIGNGPAVVIPMLVLDSVLVGYLGAVIIAANFAVARRAVSGAEALLPHRNAAPTSGKVARAA